MAPIKFDSTLLDPNKPLVAWNRFDRAGFHGVPEMLVADIAGDLHPSGVASRYIHYCAQRTDGHLVYQLGVALSLLATCVPQFLELPAVKAKANIYVALVGPSREARKSYAIELGLERIRDIESVSPLLRGRPRALCEQGSVQRLHDEIIDNPQALLWIQEFGTLLAESRHSAYMKPLRDRLCSLADCFPTQRATIKKGTAPIQRDPRLSVLAACTPGHLRDYTGRPDWTTGFLARFLFLFATPERDWSDGRCGEDAVGDAITHDLTAMAALRGKSLCTFSEEASAYWEEWKQSVKQVELHETDVATPCVKAAEVQARKIAMLLGFDRLFAQARYHNGPADVGKWEISGPDMRAALRIANLHIMSVLRLTMDIADSPDAAVMRRLLSLIDSERPTTLGTLLRQVEIKLGHAQQYLATLLARGQILHCSIDGQEAYLKVMPGAAPPPADVIPLQAARAKRAKRSGSGAAPGPGPEDPEDLL